MTYSIWLEPSNSDKQYLNNMIKIMAKKYNAPNFSAHITLFSGIGEYKNAKNAINECRFLKKIHMNVIGIGDSDYLWKTVFLNIKNDDL